MPRSRSVLLATLTVLALLARALMGAIPAFWAVVALSYAFHGEADSGVDISAAVFGLTFVAGAGGILFARRSAEVRARMALGPQTVSQWRRAVLLSGIVNLVGGIILRANGSKGAATLAVVTGFSILVLELLAILASRIGPSVDPDEIPTVTEPIEVPRWLLAGAYWLTIGPFVAFAGAHVTSVPLALFLLVAGISESAMELAYWPIQILGCGVGIGLAWLVWRQVAGYVEQHSE